MFQKKEICFKNFKQASDLSFKQEFFMNENENSHILVVDDNPDNLRLIIDMLNEMRFNVRPAKNGQDALNSARAYPPDLILLDILMPKMDGYETCKMIKSDNELKDIPVIFISALKTPVDKVKAFAVGGVDYVNKPFNKDEFIARITTHLSLRNLQKSLAEKNIELRRAKDAAISANNAKSEFLANISHEIRNPMNAIIGMVDLSLLHNIDENLRENLFTVKDSANHLLDIINDILDISKIEAGKIELEIIDFDIIDLIQSIIRTFTVQVQQNKLYLKFEKDETISRYVKGDPLRLRQILANLIGNAIKFTHEGGVTVRVSASEQANKKIRCHISIMDTGIGIPENKIQSIFDNFNQANKSMTRKYGGTGLGLSISKQLVELMDGSIDVHSIPEKGTTFNVAITFNPGNKDSINKNKRSTSEKSMTEKLDLDHLQSLSKTDTSEVIQKELTGILKDMPEHYRIELKKSLDMLDINATKAFIDVIKKESPHAASVLMECVRKFDFKSLEKLLFN